MMGKAKTILQIQYDSVGLDLPNGQTGYSEFRFTKDKRKTLIYENV